MKNLTRRFIANTQSFRPFGCIKNDIAILKRNVNFGKTRQGRLGLHILRKPSLKI